MSTGPVTTKDFFKLWAMGEAYWIVKLAFHPEMTKYFKAHGGKHGEVKTPSGENQHP